MSVKCKEKEKVWEFCEEPIFFPWIHPQQILVYLSANLHIDSKYEYIYEYE